MSEHAEQSYKIAANEIEASQNHDVLMVSFASLGEEDEPHYLVLQRDLGNEATSSPPPPVYIELNEQSASWYGGIEAVVLSPTRLQIQIADQTAEALALGPEHGNQIDVTYTLEADEYEGICDAMRRLFEDHPGYKEAT